MVLIPSRFVTVALNVVVSFGLTVFATELVTVPTPLSILILVWSAEPSPADTVAVRVVDSSTNILLVLFLALVVSGEFVSKILSSVVVRVKFTAG